MSTAEEIAAAPDALGAFVEHGRVVVRGSASGPLADIPFAVKDSFDVIGVPSGNGNPTWLAHNPVPTENSPAVQRMLDAGAVLVGKTQMDELGWSLNGINHHYGIPINPVVPDRIPGGSSSGSVSVVAGGIVPFALAADGGGSVRTPASYCGVIGMRPTHGRIPDAAMSSTATAGWFARDIDLFITVGSLLLDGYEKPRPPGVLLIADDLFDVTDPGVRDACAAGIHSIEAAVGAASALSLAEGDLAGWRDTFREVQAGENWSGLGGWITEHRPTLGPDIQSRFDDAAGQSAEVTEAAGERRVAIRRRLAQVLADDAVLIVPSAVGIAPLRTASLDELEERRAKALMLLCPAGLGGLPQISLPLAELSGCPIGLSLVAAQGGDEMLLELARTIMRSVPEAFPAHPHHQQR